MTGMNNKTETQIADLISIGALDIDDLGINKAGRLSNRQKRRLYFGLSLWLALAVLEISGVAPLIYIAVFLLKNIGMIIIAIGLLIMLLSSCLNYSKPIWHDIQDDKPRTVSGAVFKHDSIYPYPIILLERRPPIGYCNIIVQDQNFSVSPQVYDCVEQGERYRLYYLENTKKIINIEPL